MATFCIPPALAEQLKAAAVRGEIDIQKMYEMTSQERRSLFTSYVDGETASKINAGFEKAMVSESITSLKSWAKQTFSGTEEKSAKYQGVLKKIEDLNNQKLLSPAAEKQFFEDLVAEKLGLKVTEEEAKKISDLSTDLEKLASELTSVGDSNTDPQKQLEYFKARRKLDNYLDSITPSGKVAVLTSTIARGNMLLRLGSILVNINSNNIEGAAGTVVRRIDERAIGGLNNKYLGDQIKFQIKVFNETGYDLTRLSSLDTDRKILGEDISTAQGEGLIRKAGRVYEDLVFRKTQGLPDVMAASFAANDRGNIVSTKIALAEGLKGKAASDRALEIFKDASLVEPKTKEGKLVRDNMIADATRSTNTDKRFLADKALQFRKILNVGDLKFGDMSIPFVKTTANAIQSSLEYSGITVPIEVPIRLINTINLVRSGSQTWGEASKESFKGFGQVMIRAGLGSLAAWLLANAIDKDKFMGVYPTTEKERELLRLKNAVPNSILVGDKWVSLDWFGPLAAPLVGHLNARKYGTNFEEGFFKYLQGTGYQVLKTPGLDFFNQTFDSLKKSLEKVKDYGPEDIKSDIANYLVDYIGSRALPGAVTEFAQFTDTVQRDTDRKKDILAPLKNKIPGLRSDLPEKLNAFGETTPTEGWKVMIFGGRIKQDQSNFITDELDRLNTTGNLPSITNVEKTSPRAKELKNQIGDEKFAVFMKSYGLDLRTQVSKTINDSRYKKLPDEKKKAKLESVKDDLFEKYLSKFGYKKPKD